MKKNVRLIALIVVAALAVILLGRELGFWSANLYRSRAQSEHTFSAAHSTEDDSAPLSYCCTLRQDARELLTLSHLQHGAAETEIAAIFERPTFSGNDWLPLGKHFEMTWRCTFETPSPTAHDINGQIEGKVDLAITGLCTRRHARELARREALQAIQRVLGDYLKKR